MSSGPAVRRVLERLPSAFEANGGWKACCPAHPDENPSLSIDQGKRGAVLKCWAGCTPAAVVKAIGLSESELFDDHDERGHGSSLRSPRAARAAAGPKAKSRVFPSCDDAVQSLSESASRAGNTLTGRWDYRDADGGIVGIVVRIDTTKAGERSKEFRQVSQADGGWVYKGPDRWPLYHLADVTAAPAADAVFVSEGEKAADAVGSLGLVSVCSAGGSNAPKKTDWSPLAGRRVVILPDNDKPGTDYAKAVGKILRGLSPAPSVTVFGHPDRPVKGDMADLVKAADGDDDRLVSLKNALVDAAAGPADPEELTISVTRPAGRSRAVIEVVRGGATIHRDVADTSMASTRDRVFQRIRDRYPSLDPEAVMERLLNPEEPEVALPEEPEPVDGIAAGAAALADMSRESKATAEEYLHDPALHLVLSKDLARIGIAGETRLALLTYLVGTSRLLRKPLAIIAQGPSSSGKSYVIETAATLFPPEAVLLAKQITPNALFYMKPGALVHRFVVLGERSRVQDDETAEGTRALREMLSSGHLSKLVPVKVDGVMETVLIEQRGPIALAESTTVSQIFPEDRNRCIISGTDERDSQTRNVMMATALAAEGLRPAVQPVVDIHHALQRMLAPLDVVVPFARELTAPAIRTMGHVIEARRAFGMLLDTVRAIALLYQCQRKRSPSGAVMATRDDYGLACELLEAAARQTMGYGTSEAEGRCEETIQRLVEAGELSEPFTAPQAARAMVRREDTVRGWLKHLAAAGKLVEEGDDVPAGGGRGRRPSTYRLPTPADERPRGPAGPRIPMPEDVWPEVPDEAPAEV